MKTLFIIIIAFLSFQCYDNSKVEKMTKVIVSDEIVKNQNEVDSFEMERNIEKSSVEIPVETQEKINRNDLLAFATTFLGTPYVYAKQDPKVGFDCSGFINYVFKNYNITVPRSSSGFKNFGRKIAIEDVKVGDVLVFTGYRDTTIVGHLGIVSEANGMNSKFIHASSGKVMEVTISELNSTHYSKRFLHAVDVINQ